MEGRKVHALLHNEELHFPSETLQPFWIPSSSPSFHGSSSILSFENGYGESSYLRKEEGCDGDCNGFFLQPGKKRRLQAGQVQFLEKYFGEENKLEPQRKDQLAKEVGLQPRQVAIWFQNRRARYKTKQLEKDYDSLKASYDQLQSEFDDVLKEKEKLIQEVVLLRDKLRVVDDREVVPQTGHETGYDVEPLMLVCKQEDASSAKSDVLDSNSPHYTEAAGSSDVFGSDFDEGGDSGLSFLKLHDQKHGPNAVASSCNFGLPAEDQFFCFWP